MGESQNEIPQSLDRVRQVFESSPDLVICFSASDATVLFSNRALQTRFTSAETSQNIASVLFASLREKSKHPRIRSHKMSPEAPPLWVYWEHVPAELEGIEIFKGLPLMEQNWSEFNSVPLFERDRRLIFVLVERAGHLHILKSNPSADMHFFGGSQQLSNTPFEMGLPGWYLDPTRHLFKSALQSEGHSKVDLNFQIPGRGEVTWRVELFSSGQFLIVVNEEIPGFRKSQDHIEAAFDFLMRLPELVIAMGADGKILMRNDYLEATLGFPPKELLSRSIYSLLPTNQAQILRSAISETLQSQLLLQGVQTDFYAFSGERMTISWTLIPVINAQGEHWIFAHGRDVRKLQHSFTDNAEGDSLQVFTTAKLVSLGEMAAGLAHEISNPLAIIVGRAQQASRALQAKEISISKIEGALTSLNAASIRISEILDMIREFARDSSQDPMKLTSLNQIIKSTLAFCHAQMQESKISLEVEQVPVDLMIECRPQQISEALWSLLVNSQDAVASVSDKWIKLGFLDFGEFIEISVTDSGPGIPAEIRHQFLQPFFTTKDPGKGTGLGLSVAFWIVRAHQGELYLDDSSQHTRMVIKLPKKMN